MGTWTGLDVRDMRVTVYEASPRTVLLPHQLVALYTACRACGATMQRSTRCPRCRAWCR